MRAELHEKSWDVRRFGVVAAWRIATSTLPIINYWKRGCCKTMNELPFEHKTFGELYDLIIAAPFMCATKSQPARPAEVSLTRALNQLSGRMILVSKLYEPQKHGSMGKPAEAVLCYRGL